MYYVNALYPVYNSFNCVLDGRESVPNATERSIQLPQDSFKVTNTFCLFVKNL